MATVREEGTTVVQCLGPIIRQP